MGASNKKPSGALLKAYIMLVTGAGIESSTQLADFAYGSTGCLLASEGFQVQDFKSKNSQSKKVNIFANYSDAGSGEGGEEMSDLVNK